jgi:glyoxylase-like metal-dependent hydrolase (beta-lactamase superfamily II)
VTVFRLPVALLLLAPAAGYEHPRPRRTEVAPGIYLFQTAPYGDVGLDGNSVAIVSREGVFVFDANGTPAAASAVLSGIRAVTEQPVRFLAYSHWHWDHWYGGEVYWYLHRVHEELQGPSGTRSAPSPSPEGAPRNPFSQGPGEG